MRLSSSSLVMASASTSCSVRSEKFLTRDALRNRRLESVCPYIRTIPNRNGSVTVPCFRPPRPSREGRRETCNAPESFPPPARAGDPADDAPLLALRARSHLGRARPGDRWARPRLPRPAFLRRWLAHAGWWGRDRRDDADGADPGACRGGLHHAHRPAAALRPLLQRACVAARPCRALRRARISSGEPAAAESRDRRARLLRRRRAAGRPPAGHTRAPS